MKIAVISMIREPWGGSEELWFAMAKQAMAEGHTVMHLSFDFDTLHPRLKELRQLGAQLFRRPGYYRPGLSPKARAIRMLINFIKKRIRDPFVPLFRQRPDIVLYNGTCYSIGVEKQLMKALLAGGPRFFIIGHLNGEQDRGFGPSERDTILAAYGRAEKVFFISRRSEETARRQLCRDIPNAAQVRNPVNMPDISALPFPSQDAVHWALVGNLLTAHKGQDMLLSVLKESKWQERNWILNIYGDGPDKQYLQELAEFYGLKGRVFFHGRVGDIRQVWRDNQVLLMPSHMEGMPLAIVEAMLCGRPCVATDVGGAAEWIEDGISGFLADAAAIPTLDKALERAWSAREEWPSIGLRAHQRALELYDPAPGKTLLDKLMNTYTAHA
ncbi:glycosyltransferase [Flavitalea sp. BT771]|uniref:glycosyltransferase n=1 Tax=Flavitalea sp. BT771 TaxID=3063329 RepID=UPI0026E442D1|nr:glycosyltransferase [Flavitalea sp. BT771]MDO6431428.1 glycosyltransferase [Flavitalea sp. BT771]MDV6220336.1 glycosyltransferase [Flavitalea sp. BT771]